MTISAEWLTRNPVVFFKQGISFRFFLWYQCAYCAVSLETNDIKPELLDVVGSCSFQKANILHSLAWKMWYLHIMTIIHCMPTCPSVILLACYIKETRKLDWKESSCFTRYTTRPKVCGHLLVKHLIPKSWALIRTHCCYNSLHSWKTAPDHYSSSKLNSWHYTFRKVAFSWHSPNPDSSIGLPDGEAWFIIPESNGSELYTADA